jgi:hypothetical protein
VGTLTLLGSPIEAARAGISTIIDIRCFIMTTLFPPLASSEEHCEGEPRRRSASKALKLSKPDIHESLMRIKSDFKKSYAMLDKLINSRQS